MARRKRVYHKPVLLDARYESPLVAKLLEQQVSVTTTLQIPKGWQIHPAQGTLRCGKLEVYSTLNHDNVSTTFSERSEVRNYKTIAEKMSTSIFVSFLFCTILHFKPLKMKPYTLI